MHPDVQDIVRGLARSLSRQGKHAEVEALFRQGLDDSRNANGQTHQTTLQWMGLLERALRDQDRREEADLLRAEIEVVEQKASGSR